MPGQLSCIDACRNWINMNPGNSDGAPMTASVRLELQKELAKLTERKPNNHECIKRAAEIVRLDHDRYSYRRGDLRNCHRLLALEASMNVKLIPSALIISGLIAVAAPSNLSLAQWNDVGLSTSKNMTVSASLHKHRYWRHRGGKHPHYGSRRVRT
jgi:hypothetical protein